MQTQRFELKYLLSERTALAVRDFVSSYLELDEYCVSRPDLAYPIHSLYLDSRDLLTHQQTINGTKNRFKLRLRYYDDNPETPVFFEIKRRMNNCILKQRGGVRREAVPMLLAGQLPDPAHLVAREERQIVALQRFCQLVQELDAKPKLHVAYEREAYVPAEDNSARLTMDRRVRVQAQDAPILSTQMSRPAFVWPHQAVLELKFTNRFPDWFGELVRRFGLRPRGAAKYVDGVETLEGEFGLRPRRRRRSADSRRAELCDDDPTLITRPHLS
jgi:hypothetical protein